MIILDGGMGQELVARADAPPTPLWATQVLLDQPDIVRAIHDDYFAAGAEVATANTYAIHHDRLIPFGIDDQFEELHLAALRIACAARDAHGSGRVAGSLGPLGWSYDANTAPPAPEAAKLYAEIVGIQEPHVDLFLIETMAGIDQARGALMGCAGTDKPVWLSLSVDDSDGTKLRSGEDLADMLTLIAEFAPAAVLINCSVPEVIKDALPVIARAGVPFGAYANGFTKITPEFVAGTTVKALEKRVDLTPDAYAEHARVWADLGATIIGGCCEVGPAHIHKLAEVLG